MAEASYQKRIQQELGHYAAVENVNDLPQIFHYWSNKYLAPKMKALRIDGIDELYASYIEKVCAVRPARVVSVGAGNCDTEVRVAMLLRQRGHSPFEITCVDLNPDMLARGRAFAQEKAVADVLRFEQADYNKLDAKRPVDVVMANQSLHHCLELERLFDWVAAVLPKDGWFVTSDIIGRNGHMRWPEALDIVEKLWSLLPGRCKLNNYSKVIEQQFVNWDCSNEGFEGIRAQDILPLLVDRFHFELFLGFGNVIDPFTDRAFGHNFDPKGDLDRAFIDYVALLDESLIEAGVLKPAHMIAAITPDRTLPPRFWRNLSPEFCVRPPPPAQAPAPEPPPTTRPSRLGARIRQSDAFRWAQASGFVDLMPRRLKNFIKSLVDKPQ